MKKRNYLYKVIIGIIIYSFIVSGCSSSKDTKKDRISQKNPEIKEIETERETNEYERSEESLNKSEMAEPEVVEADWSEYFNGMNGTAVIYNESEKQYTIFNDELAMTQRSPCSTFKIISSLIALENEIIERDNSTHTWSGEIYWNEKWNKDIDFTEAFHTSCVWYFREVIDAIGQDKMQAELNKLQYGNCDISDWEGRLNTNNNNRKLTGFWLESSLKISPKEQVGVMERIFGMNTQYGEKTRNELKQVMFVSEQNAENILIYGKTGMGKSQGIVVDCWFTGFAESTKGNIYFSIYMGQSDGASISSAMAKEIGIQIVSDYCN